MNDKVKYRFFLDKLPSCKIIPFQMMATKIFSPLKYNSFLFGINFFQGWKIGCKFFITLVFIPICFLNSFSQQNLFNIPSGDITPKNKFFYQHQANFYQNKFDSKSHVVYGIGRDMDIGVNFLSKGNSLNKPFQKFGFNDNIKVGSLNPILVFSFQKKITLIKKIMNINIGTQTGLNLTNNDRNIKFVNLNYALINFLLSTHSRMIIGMYFANKGFTGTYSTVLPMMGFETQVYKNWYLMGDWKLGRNDIGEGVLGGMFILSNRVQICGGVMIPNRLEYTGLVLELNLLGWDFEH